MNKKQESRVWFDRWAQTYDRFFLRRLMWYWQDKTITEIPTKSKAILEIACGTGIGTEKTAKLFPNAQITATDLSPIMLSKARERLRGYKNVTLKLADVERLPFKRQFDAIFCTEAFHHFPNPQKALAQMSRALKRGGTLAITDIHIRPLFLMNILFKLEPGFVRMHSCRKWRELLKKAGIQVVKQKRIGLFALVTIGRKL